MVSPIRGIIATENAKVCFDFLVYSFRFSISLGMISGGKSEFISKNSSKFLGKFGGKLGSSIGDDLVEKAESYKKLFENNCGYTFSGNSF
jgi:hypothetical protein